MKIIVNEVDKHILKIDQEHGNESITVKQIDTNASTIIKIIETAPPESVIIKEIETNEPVIIKVNEMGSPGLSAYELAVQTGFQGSFQDWLNTYDVSIINGGIIF